MAQLSEVLAFEAPAVVLHSFLVVPEPVVAVPHVKDHLLVQLQRLALSLEALLQHRLLLLQRLQRLLEVPHLVQRNAPSDAAVLLLPHDFLAVVALPIAVLGEALAVVETGKLGVGSSLGDSLS